METKAKWFNENEILQLHIPVAPLGRGVAVKKILCGLGILNAACDDNRCNNTQMFTLCVDTQCTLQTNGWTHTPETWMCTALARAQGQPMRDTHHLVLHRGQEFVHKTWRRWAVAVDHDGHVLPQPLIGNADDSALEHVAIPARCDNHTTNHAHRTRKIRMPLRMDPRPCALLHPT